MALDNYDPSTALTAYYPTRDERRPARLWATEKLLHDMAELGMVEFFEGPGTDPTGIDGYDIGKLWLRVSSGVTEEPGEVRAYAGSGDPTLLASWPLLTPAGALAYFGASVPGTSIVSAASFAAMRDLLDLEPGTDIPALDDVVLRVSDYTALKALPAAGTVVVTDPTRGGTFVWRTGDYSALVTADTAECIYVASDSDSDGDTGCWVRQGYTYVDVRWAGAVSTLASDQAPAIQAAIDIAQELNIPVYLAPGADYQIGTGLTMKYGRNSTDARKYHARMICNDAIFRPANGVTALSIVPRCLLADANTGRGEATLDIRGRLTIHHFLDDSAKALKIGQAGRWMRCLDTSIVENIVVGEFTTEKAVEIIEVQRVELRSLVARSAQVWIGTTSTNGFCGDLHFYNLEITGSTVSKPGLHIYAIGSGGGQVRGLRFWSCTIYGAGSRIEARTNGTIGDIWFNSCQWDAGNVSAATKMIIRSVESSAIVNGVHFISPYVVNQDGPAFEFTASATGARLSDVKVVHGQIGGITPNSSVFNTWIRASLVDGLVISGNIFDQYTSQPVGSSIIRLVGCENFVISDNIGKGTQSVPIGITLDSACEGITIIGNRLKATAQVDDNASGASDKIIDLNRA